MASKMSFVRLVFLTAAVAVSAPMAEAANTNYTSNRSPLASTPYVPLPMGSIRAQGWLLKQLELQKTGLTGNAEQVYGELGANSGWLGGTAPDSHWERPTYYLRGLIPLAYTLNDATLKTRAQKWIDWTINSQQASGYFGPSDGDWWARMPMLIMLEDYYEATQDPRVLTFLQRYFAYQQANVPSNGLGYWGAARVADNILAVQWLYNRNADPTLLTFMDTLKGLAEDWTTALTNGTFGDNHGVNVAEGFKLPAVWYQKSLSTTDRDAFMAGHNHGMKLHGQAHYMQSCTEFMAGKSSLQGPELCAIVDRIFSDGVTMTIVGNPKIGDITERLAFNALPACLSKTMRQQQYYALPNQAQSLYGAKGIYGQDYVDALTPSSVSGWPCCCFNWHMGWPKFVQYSWAATTDNGLAIFTYAPTAVTAKVGNGVTVTFTEDTKYPFEEQVRLTISTEVSVQFPLEVRIPEWCASPSVKVNGIARYGVTAGTFYKIDRIWNNGDIVTLDFPMTLKTTTQFNNSVAIERGPLVYSLKINENWVSRETKTANGLDFSEYEVKPTTSWNYGLIINRANPSASLTVNKGPMPENPFVQSDTPITITARAKKVPTWSMAVNGLPNEVPAGPVASDAPEESITLVPFGAENLRITYFPEVVESGFAGGLTGQYYADKNMTNLVMTRTDPAISFDWGASAPAAGMNKDNFAVRWSGQIKPRYTGSYTFYVTSDDGRRMWVNNTQIINNWTNTSGTTTGIITLNANTWYSIKLEYYEYNTAASVALEWSSNNQTREVIPPSCLRPTASVDSDVVYTFDENAGTIAKDTSGGDRHGTLMNGTMWTTGKIGTAISLDGIDDYVSVPNIGTRASFTAMAWVKVDTLAKSRSSLFWCDGWESGDVALSIADTGELCFALKGASAEEQSSAYKFCGDDLSRWKHVTIVYDSTTMTVKFYVDGVLDCTRTYSTAPVAALNGIRIGGWNAGNRSFDGKIDDFRIYSRILTDAEITAMGDTGEARGLRAQYFDNTDFTAQKLVRSDANIDFNWGTAAPSTSLGADTFSVRWTGKIRPKYAESYTFYTTSDDGVRLWIDGQLLIDNWTTHTATTNSATITLVAGRKYDIKLEYYDELTTAQIKLEWASASQARQTVPAAYFFTPEDYVDPSLAWYQFEEASGATALDSTGNGNSATLSGTYTRATGKFGKAINLNGSSGHAVMPAGIMQSCNDFTISAWVKLDTNAQWARIFDIGSGTGSYMFLCLMQGGGIRYAIKLPGGGEQICDCPIALPTGVWKHVAVTQAGSVVTIYMDGSQVAQNKSITGKPSGLGATTQSWIGRSQYAGDAYLDGMIDDFRIYTWGLSNTEIASMVSDRPDNCIGYIKKTGVIGNQALLVGKVVTWAGPGSFCMQCPEPGHHTCGIKVVSSTVQSVGAGVNVSGTLAKDANDELIINASSANPGLAKDMPKVMGTNNKNIGGATRGIATGPDYGIGINLTGVSQITWGRASSVISGCSMTIDDGSGFPIYVYGPTGSTLDGDYVRVSGVSSMVKIDGKRYRAFLTRSWDDIVVMSQAVIPE